MLALLDYVSRAHEIEIRPSSVRRPSVAWIISEPIAYISFKFWLLLPPQFFWIFIFIYLFIFFTNIFVFVNMGPYGSKNFKTLLLQLAAKDFKLFLNFLPNGPHKTAFEIFEILSYSFVTIFFQKFQFHHCSLWRYQKPQLSGKRGIVE